MTFNSCIAKESLMTNEDRLRLQYETENGRLRGLLIKSANRALQFAFKIEQLERQIAELEAERDHWQESVQWFEAIMKQTDDPALKIAHLESELKFWQDLTNRIADCFLDDNPNYQELEY